MSKSGKRKIQKPASRKGVPVLKTLYSILFLAIIALGGWLYWSDLTNEETSQSAAVTAISPPEPAELQHGEDTHTEDALPGDAHTEAEPPAETTSHEEVASHPTENSHAAEKDGNDSVAEDHSESPTQPSDTETASNAPIEHSQEEEHQETHDTEAKDEAPRPATDIHDDEPEKTDLADQTPHQESPAAPVEPVADTQSPNEPTEHHAEEAEEVEPTQSATAVEPEQEQQRPEDTEEEEEKAPEVAMIFAPEPATPLPPVPEPDLAKKSDFGILPVIGPTGRLPWRAYSRPFDDPLDRPRIAIIISEMGMSSAATRSSIQNLQGAVTLSFNPYAKDLQNWIEQARAAGHEVLLQLPMEPFGYPKNDPGPHSLLTSLTDRENLNRLDWMLGRFTGYSGVTNQMGSKFTATAQDIQPVLDVIKSRGLLFLDGRTSAKSVAGQLAAKIGVPVAINNRFLDHKADRATIDARLKDLERIARYTGTAVGIGYPYPVTLERISKWSQSLPRKGFALVPVSAAINRQEIQ